MKIIITGANSFIGRCLTKRASAAGWETVLVVRPGHEVAQTDGQRVLSLSMEEYQRLGELAGESDCLVHLAWNGTRGLSRMDCKRQNDNETYSMMAVRSVLEAGCRRIITAGSQAEYGPLKGIISEERRCQPNTEYGKAKLRVYEQTEALCREAGVSCREPRFFSLYGPGDYAGTMIVSILSDMLAGRPCLLTQCVQNWDYLYIDDAIEGLFQLCQKDGADGVYNFGSGDVRQLKEYVLEMAELTQTKSELRFGSVPYPETGMVSIWPDISKLRRELGWSAQVTFAEGIRTVLAAMNGDNAR